MGLFNKDPEKIWHKAHEAMQKQNWTKALALLRQAAEGGHALAQLRYAEMFDQGLGTAPDPKEAEIWYERSAKQGNENAMISLARLLCKKPQKNGNIARAYMWYQSAEKSLSKNKIAIDLLKRTRQEMDTIREKAMNERNEAFEKGYAAYEAEDYETAFSYFKEGAQMGCETSQQNCAIMLAKGQGTDKDLNESLYWMQMAADGGVIYAQYLCGDMYLNGMGTEPNPSKALHYYLRAAHGGHAGAQYQCGRMYYEGQGINLSLKNPKVARKWLEKAAEQGEENAIKLLEEAYLELATPEELYQKGMEEYNAGHIEEALAILDDPAAARYIPAIFLCIKINAEIQDEEAALHWYNLFLEEADYFTDNTYAEMQIETEKMMEPWIQGMEN